MAMACLRLFTLPPFPPRPLLSSPCLYSCITRPVVFLCRGDVFAIGSLLFKLATANAIARRRFRFYPQKDLSKPCGDPADERGEIEPDISGDADEDDRQRQHVEIRPAAMHEQHAREMTQEHPDRLTPCGLGSKRAGDRLHAEEKRHADLPIGSAVPAFVQSAGE